MNPQVLVLVPPLNNSPIPPEASPVGRAALLLAQEGIETLFGTGDSTWRARRSGWERAESTQPIAVHDRFPSQSRPEAYAAATAPLAHLPMGNPTSITLLCRDKITCQRHLESHGIQLPELETDPTLFSERLSTWGAAFLKPRHGALGRGVRKVVPGMALPARGEGAVPGVEDALILQRAVDPPPGSAGIAMRWLLQRLPGGEWQPRTPVARLSDTDPVANVARGAQAIAAGEILPPETLRCAREISLACAKALEQSQNGAWLIEIGVDLVIDCNHQPHVIEVNSRPRGRMEHLAQQSPELLSEHVEACAQPIRTLAAMAKDTT